MYMTEEEARGKWCPLIASGDQRDRCLASGCMAWRWAIPGKFDAIQKHREETGCSLMEAKEYVDRNHPELTMTPTRGYCGLVGRP